MVRAGSLLTEYICDLFIVKRIADMQHNTKSYKAYTLRNFREIPQVAEALSEEQMRAIEVVGNVLPFKTNNYVTSELIDWSKVPDDPMFQLTFPQRDMLADAHYHEMAKALEQKLSNPELKLVANKIRYELNPHPAGQQEYNVPTLHGSRLSGIQHKYRETVLFFPSHGQTCHAYCTFCFRWPQFVGIEELKFAMRETELLVEYIREHKEVSDVLFTGGDPLIMTAKRLEGYILPLIESDIPNLRTIRIGTKALGYWPNRFLSDKDSDDLLRLFEKVVNRGYHLAIMGHFSHPNELKTPAVREAISRVISTGAKIRTQSPVMRHINDKASVWKEMWTAQVNLGCVPYYMFVARDTGAQDYFAVTLERAHAIFRGAYQEVSGLARTVRGPSMSANPGKVQILGMNEIHGEKVFTLRFIQARNPNWVGRPFFAKFNKQAIWLDDLVPAFGREHFFFEEHLSAGLPGISELNVA